MVSPIPAAKITLSCPLWACDFDPRDASSLVVGGGGGAGRNGVQNKLTLLNVSGEAEISNAGELDLSGNEDNVASLAIGPRRDRTTIVYAGINSSPEAVAKGQNQHFRVFGITPPGKSARSGGVKIAELAREALFSSIKDGVVAADPDAYQRVLRVSQPPFEGLPQLGAVATGLAKTSQLAIFDVPTTGAARWKSRARLDLPKEAMDLDVVQTGPETYQLAYCTEKEIFTVEVSRDEITEPKCVYTLTEDGSGLPPPDIRSIRYLTPQFLFAACNKVRKGGVILHGYRLPSKDSEKARLAIVRGLPKSITSATKLAIQNLSPVSSPTEEQGDTQYVVAVAGADSSISLFTMDYKHTDNVNLLANLKPFATIKSAHPAGITGLSFSTFTPPKGSKSSGQVTLKLASVSMANTAVVHSIPLKKSIDTTAPARKGGPPKPARYIVAMKPQGDGSTARVITLVSVMFLILAVVGQAFVEYYHLGPEVLGTNRLMPASWQLPPIRTGPMVGNKFLGDLLADIPVEQRNKIVIRSDEQCEVGEDGVPQVKAEVHDDASEQTGKSWDELETREQLIWKQRLKKTGQWVEDMGETVFKGVLFGEVGGAIGAMVGEAL